MTSLIIINADDFGLCKAQNYGIIEAFKHGVVTSTTAMMNTDSIKHAAQLHAQTPMLAVGLHFVLSLGKPLTPLTCLIDNNGLLSKNVWQHAEDGKLREEEILAELTQQYQKFVEIFDCEPSHIDSHHHVHMLPQIFPIVAQFAREKRLPLRIDHQLVAENNLNSDGLISCTTFSDKFYGDSTSQELLLSIISDAHEKKSPSLEIMCHPAFIDSFLLKSGYCYPRLTELEILTAPGLLKKIKECGFKLGNYLDL